MLGVFVCSPRSLPTFVSRSRTLKYPPIFSPVNPNADAVKSESLSALWILEWTTEREILFLMENGLPGQPSGPVKQEIDVDAKTLSNIMVFGKDSLFEVASTINPEVRDDHTNCMQNVFPK